MTMNENLKAFLYLLMRDKLPTGDVVELVNESTVAANMGRETVYTAKPLAEYAGQLADRILDAGRIQDGSDPDLLAQAMVILHDMIDHERVKIVPMKTPIDVPTEFDHPNSDNYAAITRNLVADDESRLSKCAAAIGAEINADVNALKDGEILVYRPFKLILQPPSMGGDRWMFRYAKRVVDVD